MKKQPTVEARSTPIFRNTPEKLRYFYHPDHLGSTSWVTDSAKNGIQYCEYLPYGEPFLDQRSTTWNSRYTFSGKERDGETGYSYFGARYYNSDISIWLSVDPLSDKYPNLTPYAYCANNPIKYWDPDGRWIPGLDDDGNVTYTAEKGDNHDTFVQQFNTNEKGKDIFKNAGFGVKEGDVKKGDVIKGEAVKKATGSDVLKGSWYNLTKTQKAAQIICAINHSISKGEYEFDFKDYAFEFETFSGERISDITYPYKNSSIKIRNLSLWLTNNNSKVRNSFMYTQTAGDLIGKFDFRHPAENSRRSMIMFSIDNQYDESFDNLFR
jgi:RHS repeat-associated protein